MAQLNLSIFKYDYEGYQVSKIVNRASTNENIDAEVKGLVDAQFAGMKFKVGGLTPEEDAVRVRQARRIAQLGERHEDAGDLLRGLEPLGWVDADTEPRHERVELGRGEGSEDVDEPGGLGSNGHGGVRSAEGAPRTVER